MQVPDTNYSVSVKDSVTLSLNQIQSVGCAVCQSICIFSEVLKGITELHLVQQHGVYVVTLIITKSLKNLLELMSKPELKINAQTQHSNMKPHSHQPISTILVSKLFQMALSILTNQL